MDVGSVKNSPAGTLLNLSPVEAVRPALAGSATTRPVERSSAAAPVAAEDEPASRSQVEDAVSTIQEFVQSVRRSLDFQLDDSSGRVVVKVTDSESGNVIRQIPSEEALRLAESLDEVRSLLFKAEA